MQSSRTASILFEKSTARNLSNFIFLQPFKNFFLFGFVFLVGDEALLVQLGKRAEAISVFANANGGLGGHGKGIGLGAPGADLRGDPLWGIAEAHKQDKKPKKEQKDRQHLRRGNGQCG